MLIVNSADVNQKNIWLHFLILVIYKFYPYERKKIKEKEVVAHLPLYSQFKPICSRAALILSAPSR